MSATRLRSVRPSKPVIVNDASGRRLHISTPVTFPQCESAAISENNKVVDLPVLVFPEKCQLSHAMLDCKHRSHLNLQFGENKHMSGPEGHFVGFLADFSHSKYQIYQFHF